MSIITDKITFINQAPDNDEWTAHVDILNNWTEPENYLRQIIQYARAGEFHPADMHVDLIEQLITRERARMQVSDPIADADIHGHGSDLWPEVKGK